jgi:flagellin
MSVINTNITSMIGQQNLRESQSALSTSMERLSSGLRINSAKDDAAGQAIANRMTATITGLSTAQRNANDGISAAQTAEGGLNQVNDNLQRVRELTVQAQNGTNSQDDLNSIQDEITQRMSEIDRISRETDFNGTAVLADGVDPMTIQVGSKDGQTIDINFKATNIAELGLTGFNVNELAVEAASDVGDIITTDAGTAFTVTGTATTAAGSTNVTAADITLTNDASAAGTDSLVTDGDGNFFIKNDTAGEITFYAADVTGTEADGTNSATVTATVAADAEALSYISDDVNAGPTGGPLAALDKALSDVDSLRSDLGAVQNRFDSAITNLSTNETNLSAARSRIEDADYAVEVANMTRAQILQQAGTSVLAQANQVPQNVLSLLG